MKQLFIIVFLLGFSHCEAQNYQPIQAGVKRYFTNAEGYLRGMRIDSVRVVGGDTVYYPFKTPRGSYRHGWPDTLNQQGGSWLGKNITKQASGNYIFDNYWGNPVLLKPLCMPGDSWTFYSDSGSRYYKANALSGDTLTVLGVVDSVKRILVTAWDTSGHIASDSADSLTIVLSKDHGLVQAFDFYTFPYHKADSIFRQGLDFYLDQVSELFDYIFVGAHPQPSLSNIVFKLVDFINPAQNQLYDFHPGDVFEFSHCEYPDYGCHAISYTFDSVTSQAIIGDSTIDSCSGWVAYQPRGLTHYETESTRNALKLNSRIFLLDTNYMPEEFGETALYYYFPSDNSYCTTSPLFKIQPRVLNGLYVTPYALEPVQCVETYKLGLGLVSYTVQSTDDTRLESHELIYYRKGSVGCGTFTTLNLDNSGRKQAICQIFPNPAVGIFNIKTSISGEYTVSIINTLGQTVKSVATTRQEQVIDIGNILPGLYHVTITDENGNRYFEKLVIQ